MLTRLHVKGFKNLLDVEVYLGPFTTIAGLNAVGKSNLFDAIRFLHLLTRHPIMEAVQFLREAKGKSPEPKSLFTAFGQYRAQEFRLTADLLLQRDVQDDFGVDAKAAISSVRYEVGFRLNEDERPERLELVTESLVPIPISVAQRDLRFPARRDFKNSVIAGRRVGDFISTIRQESGSQIKVHQEGHGGRMVPAPKSSRTVLGGLASSDFPTLLAAHREMESWQTLLLEPSAMRAPSDYRDPRVVDSRGAFLPAAIERLARIQKDKGKVYSAIANRLAELIEDVQEIRVSDDPKTETFTLEVRGRDGTFHQARALSDGTLRFIVLAILAVDPEATGLICLEEPENGIHPERIPAMIQLLRDIAVDPDLAIASDNPLRQVIVNTHSPVVIENVTKNELIYMDTQTLVKGASRGQVAWVRVPQQSWRSKGVSARQHISPGQIGPYLRGRFKKRHEQLLLEFVSTASR
jgi:predicted ATPase